MGFYFVALADEADENKRYVVRFAGAKDVKFGAKPAGRTSEAAQRIVELMHEAALTASVPAHFANVAVFDSGGNVKYAGPAFRSIRAEATVAPVQKAAPRSRLAHDGSWRKLPAMEKKPAGWVIPYAQMFDGKPYSGFFGPAASQQDLIDEIFNPDEPFCRQFVESLQPGAPEGEEPVATAPEYTAEQLADAPPMDRREYNLIAADRAKLLYLSDSMFRARVDKMEKAEQAFADAMRRKEERENSVRVAEEARRKLAGVQ